MPANWLAGRRAELAADRILDAAEKLFAERDAATVGMNDVAAAAGCSRATLYRYFDSRDALDTAYVRREAQRLYEQLTERLSGLADPRERLIDGMVTTLGSVRENPALSSWFSPGARPIGGDVAQRSDAVQAMVELFVRSLGDDEGVEQRARWLVRVLTSLLIFPARDAAEERQLLEEFVAPVVLGPRPPSTPAP